MSDALVACGALSLLRPDIVHELELVRHGFLPLMMPSSFAPMENGDYLLLGDDHDENVQEIRRHSRRDADAYDRFQHDIERDCQVVKPLFDKVPPNIFGKEPDYLADVACELHDLRGRRMELADVYDPSSYAASQKLGRSLREAGSNGIAFDSVRRNGGECVAVFRPRLVQNVRQGVHLRYAWDGNAISEVYEIRVVSL